MCNKFEDISLFLLELFMIKESCNVPDEDLLGDISRVYHHFPSLSYAGSFSIQLSNASFLIFEKKMSFFSDLCILSCISKMFSCANDLLNNFRTLLMISRLFLVTSPPNFAHQRIMQSVWTV